MSLQPLFLTDTSFVNSFFFSFLNYDTLLKPVHALKGKNLFPKEQILLFSELQLNETDCRIENGSVASP